ncbi:GTP 3',8-cyclase MoaA [Ahniella affigens]|uniref:GTP 3',8-cyclase n=1 Tax=Ahniella affigens TaxID=2021234 RepID=A0A2P1PTS6_9GAMM|nr:GTP 3',8-cyclase MoaA [Ahniella affigens]AVP98249.1 GTP 3',8-cyclase MoaA [Ahniella affigens]
MTLRATDTLDQRGRPLHDLRISVIDRCNYRCPYCMPVERFGGPSVFLKRRDWLQREDLLKIVQSFLTLGVRKLRLTGGEPLLRPDLPELIAELVALPGVEDLALTTNGELLADKADALARAGLKRITVSLDALDPDIFKTLSGGYGSLERVLAGIDAAVAAGLAPIKINCTVLRGKNESEVLPLLEQFRTRNITVRFIEYMDVGTCNRWQRDDVVDSLVLRDRIHAWQPIEPVQAAYRGEVASRYRFVDGQGEVGFISSISQPFCGDCTRARLSADGQLYTCLFGHQGIDLKPWLDSPESLQERIAALWSRRADRYSEQRAEREREAAGRVEMFRIGG